MLIETQIRLVSGASFCHLHMTSTCTKGFCSATRHSLTKERQSSTWGVHLPFKAKINKRATCTSFIRVTPEMDSLLTSKWERAWSFNLGTQVSREVRRVLIILNGQHSLEPALFQQRLSPLGFPTGLRTQPKPQVPCTYLPTLLPASF